MNVKEMNIVMEGTLTSTVTTATITTSVTNPTGIITQVASKEYLKILELTEYCRIAQSTIKECETKIQALVSSKNDNAKLKMEYLTRDKINVINYESLLQAKNELRQYKCELKSTYVEIEKARKSKKLQYEKLISSYEAEWQKALGEYSSNPLVTELCDIRRTITTIEKNIELQEKLYSSTKNQVSKFYRNIKEKFSNKILEFSKAMIEYKKFLISREIQREKSESEQKHQENGHIKFSKSLVPTFAKDVSCNKDGISSFPGIDVSVFDKLMVPTENLETQNEEEELFHLIQDQNVQIDDENGDQESTEIFLNDYHQTEDQEKTKTQTSAEGNAKQNTGKAERDENESQYFRSRESENLYQRTVQKAAVGNRCQAAEITNEYENKKFNENPVPPNEMSKENNEKTNSEDNIENNKQIEGEKSFSEASYDNQSSFQKENFEYADSKTHSVTSEEMPVSVENANESFGSLRKAMNAEPTSIFKFQDDQEKEEPKSFGDFFGISSDKNSTKPSIFKLF